MPKRMSTAHASRCAHRIGLGGGALLLSLGLATTALAQTTVPAAAPATSPPGTPASPGFASSAPGSTVGSTVGSAPTPAPAPVPASPPPPTAEAGAGPVSQAELQTALGREKAARIESHIDRLHADLKITAAQEPVWQTFAGTMRANAVQMDGAYTHRQQNYAGMNAVQDLQSYGEVEQTNARNIAQLLPPFQALYSALSPQQQKLADGIFVRHIDKAVKKNG